MRDDRVGTQILKEMNKQSEVELKLDLKTVWFEDLRNFFKVKHRNKNKDY